MKIAAVRTDEETGRAKYGSIEISGADQFSTEPLSEQDVRKEHGAVADPHHPEFPILLQVVDGTHTITVPALDGRSEVECPLVKGDLILFCDYKPEKGPDDNRRFSYTGHWSAPGLDGVTLRPMKVLDEVDLDQLGWTDGLPA